ncbi:hypothetical protein ABT297_28900 [Dactylosporangium sp. NPDC000555]|uniref:hypothetical protein n=1 Tax=Dactylosporangium sp. NPDC000555 TaxID=3154260 RepID=UPI00332F20B5
MRAGRRAPGEIGAAVRVEGALERLGLQVEGLRRTAEFPQVQTARTGRDRRARAPLQAEPLDELPGADSLQRGHAPARGCRVVVPVRRREPDVLRRRRPGRQDLGQRGADELLAGVGVAVGEVEEVHQVRVR